MKELEKIYDPSKVEDRIYKLWIDGGYFAGNIDKTKEPFTIVIPPPNITGELHLGHALNGTIQDVLTRFKRMCGYATLWLPGTDHAGIATQIRVEENLRADGVTRHDLGREKFLEHVWEWKNKYGNIIVDQFKKLGSSCDWDRERFTMDEGCSRAVREVFVSLYEKGLIYNGNRIINWCPNCATALSDTEVEHSEREGKLYYVSYQVKDSDEYLTIATTRPETILGDTGVAVNPNDERYTHLINKTVILPLIGREIPIVADDYVDISFGTGCVKMTPCHDPNDFEVALRHDLEHVIVISESAQIINAGKYNGLDRYDARKEVLKDLEAQGFLVKTEKHTSNIGSCYRCDTIVEPLISSQWFVKMQPLAKEAIEVVQNGSVVFVPQRFSKIYTHWMENVRDWCISRQLWWGHRIPAWYCDCGHVTVLRDDPDKCGSCGSTDITRDEDVLDTWFSSALWPFSTLGWPDKTEDLDFFYPTSVLVTGYDIIFFWVARMIFSGLEHMDEKPFNTVLINGIVRDAEGKKMSKSAGNGIDPLELITKYGADALRFNLMSGNSPGNDTRLYPERCEAMRNFANKIWNAGRFVMMNLSIKDNKLPLTLELEDKWILSQLNKLAGEVRENLESFELGVAAAKTYDFIWDIYCDWFIELCKPRLQQGSEQAEKAQRVLLYVLVELLTILHPFMPFITEEIYQALPIHFDGSEPKALIIRNYPAFSAQLDFPREEADFESIMNIIRAIRSRRSEMNVAPSKRTALQVVTEKVALFETGRSYILRLAYGETLNISDTAIAESEGYISVVTNDARVFIPLAELVDLDKERERVEREISKAKAEIERIEKKLSNPEFISKAPEKVINTEKEKLLKQQALLKNLQES